MTTHTADPLLTAAEAAEMMRCHRRTVYRMTRRREIPARRGPGGQWLYRLSDLQEYLDGRLQPARAEADRDIDWGA